jgi:hypothetical protein
VEIFFLAAIPLDCCWLPLLPPTPACSPREEKRESGAYFCHGCALNNKKVI